MSSKTDSGDGGKGAPPMKPKVEGGYNGPRRENKKPAATRPARVTFGGLTEDLKGHIYDMVKGSQADQFTSTNKALASCAGRKCANPQDLRIAIECQKDVSVPIPTTRTNIDEELKKLLLGKEIDTYNKRSQQYRKNKAKIYSVALRKCTEAMKNCLEGEETYEDIDGESDIVRLLLLIKSIAYSYESKFYPVLAIHMALRKFYSRYQSSSSGDLGAAGENPGKGGGGP